MTVFAAHTPPSSGRPQPASLCVREPHVPFPAPPAPEWRTNQIHPCITLPHCPSRHPPVVTNPCARHRRPIPAVVSSKRTESMLTTDWARLGSACKSSDVLIFPGHEPAVQHAELGALTATHPCTAQRVCRCRCRHPSPQPPHEAFGADGCVTKPDPTTPQATAATYLRCFACCGNCLPEHFPCTRCPRPEGKWQVRASFEPGRGEGGGGGLGSKGLCTKNGPIRFCPL